MAHKVPYISLIVKTEDFAKAVLHTVKDRGFYALAAHRGNTLPYIRVDVRDDGVETAQLANDWMGEHFGAPYPELSLVGFTFHKADRE